MLNLTPIKPAAGHLGHISRVLNVLIHQGNHPSSEKDLEKPVIQATWLRGVLQDASKKNAKFCLL